MTRVTISFRAATTDDEPYLYQLHRATMHDLVAQVWGWDESVQRDFFRAHLAAGSHYLVLHNGEIVGTVQYQVEPDHISIGNIEIEPSHQGEGIGSAVISQVIDHAREANKPVRLQVLKLNTNARRLYERLGFILSGETETHILMTIPI